MLARARSAASTYINNRTTRFLWQEVQESRSRLIPVTSFRPGFNSHHRTVAPKLISVWLFAGAGRPQEGSKRKLSIAASRSRKGEVLEEDKAGPILENNSSFPIVRIFQSWGGLGRMLARAPRATNGSTNNRTTRFLR